MHSDFVYFLLAICKCALLTGLGPGVVIAYFVERKYTLGASDHVRIPKRAAKSVPLPIRPCRTKWRHA